MAGFRVGLTHISITLPQFCIIYCITYIFMHPCFIYTIIHIHVHIYVLSTVVHLDTHEWYMSDRLDISVVCNYYTWSLSNGPVLHCQKVSWNHHHQYIFNIILFNNKIIVIISSDSCIVFFTNVFFSSLAAWGYPRCQWLPCKTIVTHRRPLKRTNIEEKKKDI